MKFNAAVVAVLFVCSLRTSVFGKALGDVDNGPDVVKSEDNTDERQGKLEKRSYYNLPVNNPNYFSIYHASQYWKPATYSIRRPYIIPVYTVSNKFPIFYPPQPVYVNPGVPIDNPAKPPFMGEGYLPPVTPTMQPNGTIGNRLGGDDDDKPVWGGNGMPLSGDPGSGSPVPTRAPPNRQPTPPLDHNEPKEEAIPSVQRTTTIRPSFSRPASTTTRSVIAGPSNCVWAIVSCCSATAVKEFSQNCFEQRGCPGPFWGSSPCEGEFARAAIDAAVKYYANGK